ncbi:von Willebrand factor type A domain protein [Aquimixticola soesokkakensis]|uniref:von Willebrand factor type A domain protein n=1 Tax=Aquimixticola soesokkakensis TaxID=1519096 RepID=A0A1Y5SBY6_9RHOB|nr:TadE/TadG family type IV pilus assembly protein [Aquimixticola soesokkakensis]SLN37274.1 von Willebrand factor type A domain protein [Aquimixticola soesokkakensis]
MMGRLFSRRGTAETQDVIREAVRPVVAARSVSSTLRMSTAKFVRADDGSIAILTVFMIAMIGGLAGMGVDLMRHEAMRTRVQNTLDRAILAAASLKNTQDPQTVVNDYFRGAGMEGALTTITVDEDLGYRTVTAEAIFEMDTLFFSWVGIDTLNINVAGTAEQRISDLEISLVLDVSTSMEGTKLGQLKTAAKEFADTVFDASEEGAVSVSVIPYSTQVSLGSTLAPEYALTTEHAYSACAEFAEADFSSTSIDPTASLQRATHFDPFTGSNTNPEIKSPICATTESQAIMPLSGSLDAVKSKITNLNAKGNTSIDLGIKWGTALLDPETAPVVQSLVSKGKLDQSFINRPASYDDSATMKVMVVMTDGLNTQQYRINDSYTSGMSDVYVDSANRSNIAFQIVKEECTKTYVSTGRRSGYYRTTCEDVTSYYYPASRNYSSNAPGGSRATQLSWVDVFGSMSLYFHAYGRYTMSGNANDYYHWYTYAMGGPDTSEKDTRMSAICSAAKDAGIMIFTIGFEIEDDYEPGLKACASSASHYYRVEGMEIAEAFNAVAAKLTQLRLVQ